MPKIKDKSYVTLPSSLNKDCLKFNKEQYIARWQEWRNSAIEGAGEYRDIAYELLISCLNYKLKTLDFSNLRLIDLPNELPPGITTLILKNNQLGKLPETLPGNIEIIYNDNKSVMETNHNGDNVPFLSTEAIEMYDLPEDGHRLRLAAEEENDKQHLPDFFFTPTRAGQAGALLAGVGLLSVGGFLLHRQWHTSEGKDHSVPANGDLISKEATLEPGYLFANDIPQAAAVISRSNKPASSSRVSPYTQAKAIERQVVNFFRQQKNATIEDTPRKEELIAEVAAWLFPVDNPHPSENNTIQLARQILSAKGEYGGKANETLSLRMAKATVRDWVFMSVLQYPLREFIARKISSHIDRSTLTLGKIKYLISLPKLHLTRQIFYNDIPADKRISFSSMWETFIHDEIPLLDESKFKNEGNRYLTSYDLLALCTGADYLADQNILDKFTIDETTDIGSAIWGEMLSDDVRPEMLSYLTTPSLWYTAQSYPELFQTQQKNVTQAALTETLASWRRAQDISAKIAKYIPECQQALRSWQNKAALAEKIVAECPIDDLLYVRDRGDDYLSPAEINKKIRANAVQRYLLLDSPPCSREGVPGSLTAEYTRLTKNVANNWSQLDRVLIDLALSSLNKEELAYIYSPDAIIHPSFVNIRTNRTPASGSGGWVWSGDIIINLDNTDIFSVFVNGEERIYALKCEPNDKQGYSLYRVDRSINLFMKYGVLTHKKLWKNYRVQDNKILASGYEFNFEVNTNFQSSLTLQKESKKRNLIDYLGQDHAGKYYDALFEMGNDKSKIGEMLTRLKSLIPFYDCIKGLASGDAMQAAQALTSCFFDVLAFIPVVGQAAAVSGKFGVSLVQGIRSGVFKMSQKTQTASALQAVTHAVKLPAKGEIQSIMRNTLRAVDPGIELLLRTNTLPKFTAAKMGNTQAATKLKKYASEQQLSAAYQKARLPGDGPEVSVTKVEGNRWVMVNPRTGEAFGKYYQLQDNQLTEITPLTTPIVTPIKPKVIIKHEQQEAVPSVVMHNHLPEDAEKLKYWIAARGILDIPLDLSRTKARNSALQYLTEFLPEQPPIIISSELADETLTTQINNFYGIHPWRAWQGVYPNPAILTPDYILTMQAQLRVHLLKSQQTFEYVRDMLWNLLDHEDLSESFVGKYLIGILGTYREDVIEEAFWRLVKIVERGDTFLKASKQTHFENFLIVAADHIPDINHPGQYISTLNSNILKKLPVAAVAVPDPKARVCIFADRYQCIDFSGTPGGVLPGLNIRTDLSEDINHEITHLSSFTSDMFTHYIPLAGVRNNGEAVRKNFLANFMYTDPENYLPHIMKQNDFRNFIIRLLQTQGVTEPQTNEKILTAILSDAMLSANLMMSDAQVIATIIRDLAAHRPFDAVVRAERDTNTAKNSTMGGFGDPMEQQWLTIIAADALRWETQTLFPPEK